MTQPTIGHDSAMALSDEEMEQLVDPKKRLISFPKPGEIIRDPNNPNLVWVANDSGMVLHSLKSVI